MFIILTNSILFVFYLGQGFQQSVSEEERSGGYVSKVAEYKELNTI